MNQERRKVNLGEIVVPALALAFVAAYFIQVRNAPAVALYWPLTVAAALALFWVAVVVRFVWVRQEPSGLVVKKAAGLIPARVALVFFASVGYLAVVSWLGFTLSNITFMLVIFRGLGGRNWTRNIFVALAIAVFLHVALVVLMQLSLPQLDLGVIRI
jgi:hypothetical protein